MRRAADLSAAGGGYSAKEDGARNEQCERQCSSATIEQPGWPAIVKFNNDYYTYGCNLQGDVVSLIDSSGKEVVQYAYDAWGKPTGKSSTLTTALAALNPFRYRGYVYDEETGLYYLRSRYYNPAWGRFLNADTVLGQAGALLSHNLFTYCENDPANLHDPDGYVGSLLRALIAFFFDESIGSGHIGGNVNGSGKGSYGKKGDERNVDMSNYNARPNIENREISWPNEIEVYPNRIEAFDAVKLAAGIPVSQEYDGHYGNFARSAYGETSEIFVFNEKMINVITIRDDYLGHIFKDGFYFPFAHFNVSNNKMHYVYPVN